MILVYKNNNNKDLLKTILIDERYLIYYDGVIYDTLKAEDIPQHIFKMRDILRENGFLGGF